MQRWTWNPLFVAARALEAIAADLGDHAVDEHRVFGTLRHGSPSRGRKRRAVERGVDLGDESGAVVAEWERNALVVQQR